jgi:hypothetical protein
MIGRLVHISCAAALVSATALLAQPSASEGGAAKNDANKQICRTTADIGSRLARSRACHTAAEWAELRRQTRQTVDHIQNARPWNCPGCGP